MLRPDSNTVTRCRGHQPRSMLFCLMACMLCNAGCQSFPTLAGREMPRSDEDEARIGALEYQEIVAAHPLSQDSVHIQLVQQVGQRLATASGRTDLRWDFKLIQDDTPRVIALPGGRIVVADATLGICQNEAQLAAMVAGAMGRELARRSTGDSTRRNDSQQSVEADSIALSLMVGAGYDPAQAQQVWFAASAPTPGQGNPATQGTAQSRTTRHGSFLLALDRARFIYRSHPQPIGVGLPIAWQPRATPPHPAVASAPPEVWTASINRGAAKPTQWNADLQPAATPAGLAGQDARRPARTADEFLPPKRAGREIQPVVYEWSSSEQALIQADAVMNEAHEVETEPQWFAAPTSPSTSTPNSTSTSTPTPTSTPQSLSGPLLP